MKTLKNHVQLIGNLGKNPEIKDLGNNRKMAHLTIATNDSFRNAEGKKVVDTQWHNVVAWGNVADIAERYLEKGKLVAIQGKLVHRTYDDKSGIKKYITEIVANELVMLNDGREK